MRLAAVVGFALPLVPFFACSRDHAEPGTTPIEGDATIGDDGGFRTDAPIVPAVGDPCRGAPLPTGQHYVPAGMCAPVVASKLGRVRQITFAPNGDLFAVVNDGTIRLF